MQYRSVIWTWSNWTKSGTQYYTCIRLLYANFLMLKLLHTFTYCLTTWYNHPILSVTSITYFFCIWCEVWFVWNKQKQHCCYNLSCEFLSSFYLPDQTKHFNSQITYDIIHSHNSLHYYFPHLVMFQCQLF